MKDKSRLFQNLICNGTKPVVESVEEVKPEKKTRKKKEK